MSSHFITKTGEITDIPSLIKAIKSMDDAEFHGYVNENKNDFYNWILDSLKQERLARRIRNLKLKQTLLKELEAWFEGSLERHRKPNEIRIKQRFYTDSVELYIDLERCFDCELCQLVCEKEAAQHEGSLAVDKEKCCLCGLCVPFCPSGAIRLLVNGEEKNLLLEAKSMPRLPELEDVNGVMAKKLFIGDISIKAGKCPKDCEACIAACPTGAMKRIDNIVTCDKDSCILCGACRKACKDNLISIRRQIILKADREGRERLSFRQSLTDGKNNLEKMRGDRSFSERACPWSASSVSEHFDKSKAVEDRGELSWSNAFNRVIRTLTREEQAALEIDGIAAERSGCIVERLISTQCKVKGRGK
ncbi:hypothetical protein COT48_03310 [Candidatus Woesearchaeota archaeon CG08_land_8_20_14_0_20_47_9]|nr:MAG: hypothetical protein COT48_03310 [Candidatus Woesearchaeota archaeon CG08_land_8_20_14_0_20_47_9]